MQIDNPFQMNDWEINKFLKVVLAVQFAMWGVIGLDILGMQIPILRPFIGFIYLLFIPGILILRVLKLHKLGNIETLLYTVGLSIATLMAIGFLLNGFLPLFGFFNPISVIPLIFTISVVVLGLCYICYKIDNGYSDPSLILVTDVLSPPALFLCLIPFLSIFGTYFVNYYQNNILLMILIVTIALLVILIGFDKAIPIKFYPLAIYVIGLSLLFHNSLISNYTWGWDGQIEYYLSNVIKTASYWDPSHYNNVNAMLSIIILAPIFSIIDGISLTWVFKIIYPLIYSIVPVGLYRVFQQQVDEKIAFLSVFFFMSFFAFYLQLISSARLQIAELFLVSFMLLLFNKDMSKVQKSVLVIIFLFSLSVSHYGLSYIFMASLVLVWFLLYLNARYHYESMNSILTSSLVLLYIVFAVTWYINISSSSNFNTIIKIGDHIVQSIASDFLNPEVAQGLAIIQERTNSKLHDANLYIHLISQVFIGIGILSLLFNRCKATFKKEYVAFSYVNFIILLAGIAVPFVASALNTPRLYQMSLIFLAPFCVIGGITFFNLISSISRRSQQNQHKSRWLKILSVFLAIYLLFNTGWIYEIKKDNPNSFSLSVVDYPIFNEQEIVGAKWLNNVKVGTVYADIYRRLLSASFDWGNSEVINSDDSMKRISYIYFGTKNVKGNEILVLHKKGTSYTSEYISSKDLIEYKYRIYTNGGSQIYYQ